MDKYGYNLKLILSHDRVSNGSRPRIQSLEVVQCAMHRDDGPIRPVITQRAKFRVAYKLPPCSYKQSFSDLINKQRWKCHDTSVEQYSERIAAVHHGAAALSERAREKNKSKEKTQVRLQLVMAF